MTPQIDRLAYRSVRRHTPDGHTRRQTRREAGTQSLRASRKVVGLPRAGAGEGTARRSTFVAEGKMSLGPSARYFVFLEGEYLGQRLVDHFGLPEERGYTDLGGVRITVERLDEPRA